MKRSYTIITMGLGVYVCDACCGLTVLYSFNTVSARYSSLIYRRLVWKLSIETEIKVGFDKFFSSKTDRSGDRVQGHTNDDRTTTATRAFTVECKD